MSTRKVISFTPESLAALKRAYNRAVKDGKDTFMFNGSELLTAYAKYLIEFLESAFKERGDGKGH